MNDQANVYRIRKNKNSFWFFKDWNGCEPVWYAPFHPAKAPAFTIDEAEQIACRLPESVVEIIESRMVAL